MILLNDNERATGTNPWRCMVRGVPAPKGSLRAFNNPKTGIPIVTEGRTKPSKTWQAAVQFTVGEQWGSDAPLEGPVNVWLAFALPRPKSVKRPHPSVKPDIDKLARAVLDGMTGIVFQDDAQVVYLSATKAYQDDELGGEYITGVMIQVVRHG
jgi:Holliday junction resolvase RusA-like endonuclease